mgnify:FL=1
MKRLSVEMGRTVRLAPYNAYRKRYGLKPMRSFRELTRDRETAAELERLYGHIDRLEWFVGLFAEHHEPPHMMGELLRTMVANDAFTQALTNPLMSKCVFGPEAFTNEGLKIIGNTRTLADLIVRNTKLTSKRQLALRHRSLV